MESRVDIGKYDAAGGQVLLWVFTGLNAVSLVPFFIWDFNLNLLAIALVEAAVFGFLHYRSLNFWSIWYENGDIHFKNLYKKQIVRIERFKKIETIGISRYQYGLFLDDNTVYPFALGPMEDLKLFFKMDREYYAKKLNAKLLELKNGRSDA